MTSYVTRYMTAIWSPVIWYVILHMVDSNLKKMYENKTKKKADDHDGAMEIVYAA